MRTYRHILILILAIALSSCQTVHMPDSDTGKLETLVISVGDFNEDRPGTKVSYSSDLNSSNFETGDSFGLFVFAEDGSIAMANLRITCTGQNGAGKNLWAKDSGGQALSDILALGTKYLAYFPYDAAFDSFVSLSAIKTGIAAIKTNIPSDQSASFTDNDFLLVSNLADYSFGQITRNGGRLSLQFSHAWAMLRFSLPKDSEKYDYLFNGNDFTPFLAGTTSTEDIYQHVIKPGDNIDLSIRYIHEKKLYSFSYVYDKPWRVTAEANTCYNFVEGGVFMPTHEDLINALGYDLMVDLGLPSHTKWASIDLRTDETLYADILAYEKADLPKISGNTFAWGEIAPRDNFSTARTGPALNYGLNIIGDANYDAARALWGENWQLPSVIDVNELYLYCTFERTAENTNVFKITGPNGNYIYMYGYGYKTTGNVITDRGNIYSHIGEALYTNNNSGAALPTTVYVNYARETSDNITLLKTSADNKKFRPAIINPSFGLVIRPVYKEPVDIRESSNIPENIAIDMGLPSGTKWAPFNIGVENLLFNEGTVSSSADMAWLSKLAGDFFAWGETATKNYFNSAGWSYSGSKTEGTNISGTQYDAATALWGNGWVMPSQTDFEELKNYCTTSWIELGANSYPYYKLTSKINGNVLILPVTGQLIEKKWDSYDNLNAMLWHSTMAAGNKAHWLNFDSNGTRRFTGYSLEGWKGLNIRPVIHTE